MKHALMLLFALIACMWQPSHGSEIDCLKIADGFLAAADAGRRGTPVGNILDVLNGETEAVSAALRVEFLKAYQRGANGETMNDLWLEFYINCKASRAEERPS